MNLATRKARIFHRHVTDDSPDSLAARAISEAPGPQNFWHPALPQVCLQHRGPYYPRVFVHRSGSGWMGPVKHRALSPDDINKRKPLLPALFLALAFPALANAAEPCKVNVTNADQAQVALLPGIGPAKAGEIVKARPKNEDELDAVKGVGEKTLANIRPHVIYAGETTCTAKQSAPRSGEK